MFSERAGGYVRFVRFVRYPQGLRAYFFHSAHLELGLRILDAGCGTGLLTLALRDALVARALEPECLHGFDLTPAMLDRFRATLAARGIRGIELAQADVLALEQLPASWREYDLVVSSAMLEYLPPERLSHALNGLRGLLRANGLLVVFITRRNWLTRPLIGRWWHSNLYAKDQLEGAFRAAGFCSMSFGRFPILHRYLAVWGHIVEARA